MANSLDKMMTNTFINIIFNWESIKQNTLLMESLNMKSNSLCQKLKEQNPTMRNSFIQAHVLALLMMMINIISLPCRNIHDLQDENIVQNNYSDNSTLYKCNNQVRSFILKEEYLPQVPVCDTIDID